MIQDDTIIAISTPPGKGGIAVIRISGPEAIGIADQMIDRGNAFSIHDIPVNTSRLASFIKGEEIIDEGLVTVFRAPHSYSGQDTVELSCHGSLYIQQQLLQIAINHGARLAEPGEFTRRAFLNGKLDLSQAEAVADLIASSTAAAHKTALRQMRGGFSKRLSELREQLVNLSSLLELELDFSGEDVEFANRNQLKELAKNISGETERLMQSFDLGNAIKNGIPVVIAGRPNVGKSTLLNNLLQEDKAIVSDIAGTTRDFIEDTININGVSFRFIDTAGLRDSEDTIEKLGIQRTHEKISQASIILLMVEATDCLSEINFYLQELKSQMDKDQTVFLIINKSDLVQAEELQAKFGDIQFKDLDSDKDQMIMLSAVQKAQMIELREALIKSAGLSQIEDDGVIITNTRHLEALKHAHENIQKVRDGIEKQLSEEFIARDIRQVLHHIGEITGEVTPEDILGNIFRNFCIGK